MKDIVFLISNCLLYVIYMILSFIICSFNAYDKVLLPGRVRSQVPKGVMPSFDGAFVEDEPSLRWLANNTTKLQQEAEHEARRSELRILRGYNII